MGRGYSPVLPFARTSPRDGHTTWTPPQGELTFVLIFVDDLTMGCMVWEWQWGHRSVVHD